MTCFPKRQMPTIWSTLIRQDLAWHGIAAFSDAVWRLGRLTLRVLCFVHTVSLTIVDKVSCSLQIAAYY
jgi:hypothetical protein